MGISFLLAGNWSEDKYVAQFWSMRYKQKPDREGVPFQTKRQNPPQNEDATSEVWHSSCHHEDKSQHHKNGRVEK